MLKRVHSETDRRVVLLRLSREGLNVAEKLSGVLEELITRILREMSPEAQKATTNAVEQVFDLSQQVREGETVLAGSSAEQGPAPPVAFGPRGGRGATS